MDKPISGPQKAIVLATLAAFAFLGCSCSMYTIRAVEPAKLTPDSEIRKVEKHDGEVIEFTRREAGRLVGPAITGKGAKVVGITDVPTADIQRKGFTSGDGTITVGMKDGRVFGSLSRIEARGETTRLFTNREKSQRIYTLMRIPFSEVGRVWTEQFDWGKFAAVTIFSAAAIALEVSFISSLFEAFSGIFTIH